MVLQIGKNYRDAELTFVEGVAFMVDELAVAQAHGLQSTAHGAALAVFPISALDELIGLAVRAELVEDELLEGRVGVEGEEGGREYG